MRVRGDDEGLLDVVPVQLDALLSPVAGLELGPAQLVRDPVEVPGDLDDFRPELSLGLGEGGRVDQGLQLGPQVVVQAGQVRAPGRPVEESPPAGICDGPRPLRYLANDKWELVSQVLEVGTNQMAGGSI